MAHEFYFWNLQLNLLQTYKPTTSVWQLGRQHLYNFIINNHGPSHLYVSEEKVGEKVN